MVWTLYRTIVRNSKILVVKCSLPPSSNQIFNMRRISSRVHLVPRKRRKTWKYLSYFDVYPQQYEFTSFILHHNGLLLTCSLWAYFIAVCDRQIFINNMIIMIQYSIVQLEITFRRGTYFHMRENSSKIGYWILFRCLKTLILAPVVLEQNVPWIWENKTVILIHSVVIKVHSFQPLVPSKISYNLNRVVCNFISTLRAVIVHKGTSKYTF